MVKGLHMNRLISYRNIILFLNDLGCQLKREPHFKMFLISVE